MVISRLPILAFLTILPFVARAEDGELALGKNLLGQDCHSVLSKAQTKENNATQTFDVFCGDTQESSGNIFISNLPLAIAGNTQDQIRTAIQLAASDLPSTQAVNLRLLCHPGKWLESGDGEILSSSCTYREGGWQAVTVTALRGDRLIQGDGPPSLFPVLTSFVSNGRTVDDSASANKKLETLMGSTASLYDAGDVQAYRDLVKQARLLDSIGNYADSEQAYRKALDVQKRGGSDNGTAMGDTLMNLAVEISNQGRFDEARELFKTAEPLVQKSLDPIDDSRFVSYLAVDAANRHAYSDTLDLARRATKARRMLVSDDQTSKLGQSQGTLANTAIARAEIVQSRIVEAAVLMRMGDYSNALEAAAEVDDIVQAMPGVPEWWRAESMVLRGEIEGRLGHQQVAEVLVKGGIAIFQKVFANAQPTALAWISLGKVYADGGDYPKAMDAFRQGLAMLQLAHKGVGKISFDAVSAYFKTALEYADHDDAERDKILAGVFAILQDVQKGKESEIVGRSVLRLGGNDPKFASLLRDLQDAQKTRDDMRLSLATAAAKNIEARDPEREAWLAEQYRFYVGKVDRIEKLLQEFPEYSKASKAQSASLLELQSQLRPGEAFVTFAFGDEFGMVFAVSPNRIDAKILPGSTHDLEERIRELRDGVIVKNGRVGIYDLQLAYTLYRQLFGPVSTTLNETTHLIIASSGAVASLPIAALLTDEPNGKNAAWLIRRAAISQVPSATAFLALRKNTKPSTARLPFLGVGNPRFTGSETGSGIGAISNNCRTDGPMPPDLLLALPPLTDTAVEVRSVSKSLGGKSEDVLLGDQATEQGFRNRPLDQYRVLYFATHGLLPAELRCQSEPSLALSPPSSPAKSKAEDGLLEANEIAGLRLDADLVVLSACNTATTTGRFGGETLSSLADVFFYAGSRAVLATHWSVPSASTTKLMTRMFETYAGSPESGYAWALQKAQLEILSDPQTSHPLHWAAFSLIGGTVSANPATIAGALP